MRTQGSHRAQRPPEQGLEGPSLTFTFPWKREHAAHYKIILFLMTKKGDFRPFLTFVFKVKRLRFLFPVFTSSNNAADFASSFYFPFCLVLELQSLGTFCATRYTAVITSAALFCFRLTTGGQPMKATC